ncbi:MAG: NHL repeat-containing protein [Deltaproteobacteria bacterium]|nr:NHL repeat-containing protein [Deltaproteobacteria bacterium]
MKKPQNNTAPHTLKRRGLVRLSVAALLTLSLASLPGWSGAAEAVKPAVAAVLTGGESTGSLKTPRGVFFDEAKSRLYVADSANKRLVSFDSEFKPLADLSSEKFEFPVSVVRDSMGRFYIVDAAKRAMVSIDLEKKETAVIVLTGVPAGSEEFMPGRLAIDRENRLYVTDRLNKRILVLTREGSFVSEITAKHENFYGFGDVRVDEKNDVYALDTVSGTVYVFDSGGKLITRFGSRGALPGAFLFPTSLAVDKDGRIFVLDGHAGKILVFNRAGALQLTLASKGLKDGELYSPSYIYIDKRQRIFVVDGQRVQVFEEPSRAGR